MQTKIPCGMMRGGKVDAPEIRRSALLRTTRRLMDGNALIPQCIRDGKSGRLAEAVE